MGSWHSTAPTPWGSPSSLQQMVNPVLTVSGISWRDHCCQLLQALIYFSLFLSKLLLYALWKGTHQRPSLAPLTHNKRNMKVLLMTPPKLRPGKCNYSITAKFFKSCSVLAFLQSVTGRKEERKEEGRTREAVVDVCHKEKRKQWEPRVHWLKKGLNAPFHLDLNCFYCGSSHLKLFLQIVQVSSA